MVLSSPRCIINAQGLPPAPPALVAGSPRVLPEREKHKSVHEERPPETEPAQEPRTVGTLLATETFETQGCPGLFV